MEYSTKRSLQKAAVLGGGTMGMGIAAHLANCGVAVVLLTRKKEKESTRNLQNRFTEFLKSRPPSLYTPDRGRFVSFGNLDDDLFQLKDCDWIIETVVEDLNAKHQLLKRILPYVHSKTLISTNTSGLSIDKISAVLPPETQKNFLGVHFFNPPRYLKLLEIIPSQGTNQEAIDTIYDWGENVLGKRVVRAKNTPGFIANRIGIYALLNAGKWMQKLDLTIEEVDILTGEIIGRPRSATFRTYDLIGLDTVKRVVEDLYRNLEDDSEREIFKVPDFMLRLIENGWLGEKTNVNGIYKKIKTQEGKSIIQMIDWKNFEYVPLSRPKIPKLEAIKDILDVEERYRRVWDISGKWGDFYRGHLGETLRYVVKLMPDISENLLSIDQALKWGFGWEIGPFEIIDVIGRENVISDSPLWKVPKDKKFYIYENKARKYWDFETKSYLPVETNNIYRTLEDYKANRSPLQKNASASLWEVGDGVLCFEFHSKMNTINFEIVELLEEAMAFLETSEYRGMIITNQGAHFSVGFDLNILLAGAQKKQWEEIKKAVGKFQSVNQKIRFSKKPIVAGVFGMVLGGGFEIARACARIVASPESYIGLPEIGVGLIPAGGGCKEMIRRIHKNIPPANQGDKAPFLHHIAEIIGMGKVSSSAYEALEWGFLESSDRIVHHRDTVFYFAKQKVLSLYAERYKPQKPEKIPMVGESVGSMLQVGLEIFAEGKWITEHEKFICEKLIDVFCGPFSVETEVSEDFILARERENFVELLKTKKTQERIRHMLENGKPLRN